MYDHPKLENAEDLAAKNPNTFSIHDREDRESVRPGDFVKVAFSDLGERMWIKITKCLPGHKFKGTLSNTPISTDELKFGDEIQLGVENIYDIMVEGQVEFFDKK